MNAFLLASGEGTRIRPLTKLVPKCLLPVNGVPILRLWIENLIKAGVGKIFLNTCYLSDVVKKYISESDLEQFVIVLDEEEVLGTAGSLIHWIDNFIDDDMLLIHADTFIPNGINEFLSFVERQNNKNSILAFETDHPERFGICDIDDESRLLRFDEKNSCAKGSIASAATFYLERQFLLHLRQESNQYHDFSKEVVPLLVGQCFVFVERGVVIDIGTPSDYRRAQSERPIGYCSPDEPTFIKELIEDAFRMF